MNKQELLQELKGLGTGLGSAGAKMSKSMGMPGLDIKPSNSASTPPSQSPAGQVDPEDQMTPEEVEGPEIEEKLPKPEPLKLDKLGMPDKDKLKGHKVKYDGRDYILSWDEMFQVYKVVDPETKIVKTRVKPSMVSTVDFVLKDSIDDAVKALVSGEPLNETLDQLVEVKWKDAATKAGKFLWKHKGKIGAAVGLGALTAYARKRKKAEKEREEREAYDRMTPAEKAMAKVEKIRQDQERDVDPDTGRIHPLTRGERAQLTQAKRRRLKYAEQPLSIFEDMIAAFKRSFSTENLKKMSKTEARKKVRKWVKKNAKRFFKLPFSIPVIGPVLEKALDDVADVMVDHMIDIIYGEEDETKSPAAKKKDEKKAAIASENAFNASVDRSVPPAPSTRPTMSYSNRQQKIINVLDRYCDKDARVGCWIMNGVKMGLTLDALVNDLNYQGIGPERWTKNDLVTIMYLRLGLQPRGYKKLRVEFHTDKTKNNP